MRLFARARALRSPKTASKSPADLYDRPSPNGSGYSRRAANEDIKVSKAEGINVNRRNFSRWRERGTGLSGITGNGTSTPPRSADVVGGRGGVGLTERKGPRSQAPEKSSCMVRGSNLFGTSMPRSLTSGPRITEWVSLSLFPSVRRLHSYTVPAP